MSNEQSEWPRRLHIAHCSLLIAHSGARFHTRRFLVPRRGQRTVEASHEPRSIRHEPDHSSSARAIAQRDQSRLTSAAPVYPPHFALSTLRRASYSRPMAAADFNVKYVAHLARLNLTPQEEQMFGAQLGEVLGYIEKLKEVDVSQVEPTAHAVPLVNVTRPDEVRPSLSNDEALRNAPAKADGLFLVPKI